MRLHSRISAGSGITDSVPIGTPSAEHHWYKIRPPRKSRCIGRTISIPAVASSMRWNYMFSTNACDCWCSTPSNGSRSRFASILPTSYEPKIHLPTPTQRCSTATSRKSSIRPPAEPATKTGSTNTTKCCRDPKKISCGTTNRNMVCHYQFGFPSNSGSSACSRCSTRA